MTPEAFIQKWQAAKTKEKSAAQEHFIDLCRLLGEATPNEADPDGLWFCFEKGAKKTGGGDGWADVWRKGCFGWEYKGKGKDLQAALKQLQGYALALQSPPLLIVSDLETLVIHTAFTNAVQETHAIALDDLRQPEARQKLKWAFTDPERLRPGQTREGLTRAAAEQFAALALALHQRGFEPHRVAHFLNRLLFCLFAEDCDLLPKALFSRLLENAAKHPDRGTSLLKNLFQAMAEGGDFGVDIIDWFNGGLFNDADTLPLTGAEFKQLSALSRLDWSAIEPAIFGTLFERGLDPAKRSQLGAHYTDRASIMRLVDPVIREPLLAEWEAVKADIQKDKTKARTKAQKAYIGFLERLKNFRVLDPACGSGNFLYLALQTLKDLEHQAILEAETLGLPRQFPAVGPEAVHGIELNPYAAELARVTVWIGEIQWMIQHGYNLTKNPILRPLDTIEQRDAVLNADGTEAAWPEADVIIGNPPFLGGSKLLGSLGEEYTHRLRACYQGRVPGGADLVCYWFEKARAQIAAGKTQRAGLVSTNSIRGGANRKVLERILYGTIEAEHNGGRYGDGNFRHLGIDGIAQKSRDSAGASRGGGAGHRQSPGSTGHENGPGFGAGSDPHRLGGAEMDAGDVAGGRGVAGAEGLLLNRLAIFNAWSDEPWINEGAAVRVSLIGFCRKLEASKISLNGKYAEEIYSDLTAASEGTENLDLTQAKPISTNFRICFMGASKKGPFDIPGELARTWLEQPNPHSQPNSDVLRPLWNGLDLTRRPRDIWVIDFGVNMDERNAVLYEAPYEYVLRTVKPISEKNRDAVVARSWWRLARPRPDLRDALRGLSRYIATPEVAKYRLFAWMNSAVLPDQKLYAIARADDAIFGVLHSRFHELWSLAVCTWHGVGNDPRYTPTTTFETFPFPEGVLTHENPDAAFPAIAEAAKRLHALRESWLNPPEWTERVPEVVPGYPDRILPKPGHAADLKKRTLTNLYNTRPAWLDNAHKALDQAVAAAYGWTDYTEAMPDAEILGRLLKLNLERA
ncbi:Methyltransferase domain-containing protein [Methylomagnum ishizawai]|uniref:site-specific DNA-methyltransferase (adenine-specific) n=1 Tax=Methylomagnum ishizawai TaxID=1760988 RepID=A0A1Y6D9T5_9GAMM|nr:DNA methyltransferase [Methylomagnum ishizawai]SMF96964.1 Methyltransferase domain-containing protein [Methylomagnum ishizawai]